MAWAKYVDPEKIKEYNRQYYELRKDKLKEAREKAKKNAVKEQYVKICPICNKEFTTMNKQTKYCSDDCKKVAKKEREKNYKKTDKYKEYLKNYTKSEKYKAIKKEYAKTQAFKDSLKRYYEKKKAERSQKTLI